MLSWEYRQRMRKFILILILFTQSVTAHAAQPFAVVELFTSEGCSSCPPADQLLQEIFQKAEKDHLAIYPLGFHVDYWNQLGWKDVYSQHNFTERQYSYAQKLNSTSVYTPQMIINGQFGFTGSDRNKAWNYIQDELNQNREFDVGLKLESLDKNKYRLTYFLTHTPTDSTYNVAILEKNLSSQVTSGENAGKILNHTQVVRSFSSLPLTNPSGEISLQISSDWKKNDLSIVFFIQDAKNMQILAVEKIPEL